MKTKLAILSGLVVVGAGIWYLFFRDQTFKEQEEQDLVGPIQEEDVNPNHLRQILHNAKHATTEPESMDVVL